MTEGGGGVQYVIPFLSDSDKSKSRTKGNKADVLSSWNSRTIN